MSEYKVGRWLRRARRAADLSQKQVAEAVGISRNTLVRYERGKHKPPLDRLEQLAGLYQQTLPWDGEIEGEND